MNNGRIISPSPPFRGEREGPAPKAWEGEVGVGERSGIRPLTPTLSPDGGEGEVAPVLVLSHHRQPKTAIPAKAGIHVSAIRDVDRWVPAFAGMTVTGR